jgi:hypothetical protein
MATKPEPYQENANKTLERWTETYDKAVDTNKKPRHRSPNYPAIGLREALERTKRFYAMDGKAGAPTETAAKHIGFASAHGQALSVLAALKSFGLLEDKSGRVAPTQRAVELLHLPEQDPRRIQSLQEAALAPTIYRQLAQQYRETGLPSDDTLKAELIAYKSFNPKSVDDFVKGFKDTLNFSGLSDFSMIESELEMNTEQAEVTEKPTVRQREQQSIAGVGQNPGGGIQIRTPMTARPSANTFIWPLSKGVTAQVTFAGGAVNAGHLELLAKYLELAKLALEAEEDGQEQ